MRKLEMDYSVAEVLSNGLSLKVLPEVENPRTMTAFVEKLRLPLTAVQIQAIKDGIADLANEPEKFRVKPKLHVDLEKGLAWPVPFPVYVKTAALMPYFMPLGISIGLISVEGKVIAIQRALANKSCKGFLGTPAGYMTIPYISFEKRELPKKIDLNEAIRQNVEDQLKHELGLISSEYSWYIDSLMEVDYPELQQEILVIAESILTADEICQRAAVNQGSDIGLAEKRVFSLTDEEVESLIRLDVPGATQHLAALSAAAGNGVHLIKKMSQVDPKIPYEKDIRDLLV